MPNPPACSSERVIESWRDHTGSSARTHHFGPIQSSEPMSRREARFWCALFAAITLGGIGLCIHFAGV